MAWILLDKIMHSTVRRLKETTNVELTELQFDAGAIESVWKHSQQYACLSFNLLKGLTMTDFNSALIERETERHGLQHKWINLARVIYQWTDQRAPGAERYWQHSRDDLADEAASSDPPRLMS